MTFQQLGQITGNIGAEMEGCRLGQHSCTRAGQHGQSGPRLSLLMDVAGNKAGWMSTRSTAYEAGYGAFSNIISSAQQAGFSFNQAATDAINLCNRVRDLRSLVGGPVHVRLQPGVGFHGWQGRRIIVQRGQAVHGYRSGHADAWRIVINRQAAQTVGYGLEAISGRAAARAPAASSGGAGGGLGGLIRRAVRNGPAHPC